MIFKEDYVKKIIKGIIVALIFWNSVYLQYIPVLLFKMKASDLTISTKCLLSMFSSLVILIIFLIIYRKDLKKDFIVFKKNFFKHMDIAFGAWMIGLFIMYLSNILIKLIFNTAGANNENSLQQLIDAMPWVMLITASIIGPINEEIVFRKTLMDIFKNKYIIIFLSFFLFGLAHVVSKATVWTDYLYIIPYGALGLSFAYADCKTNNLMPSIAIHMMHNTVLILFAIIGK